MISRIVSSEAQTNEPSHRRSSEDQKARLKLLSVRKSMISTWHLAQQFRRITTRITLCQVEFLLLRWFKNPRQTRLRENNRLSLRRLIGAISKNLAKKTGHIKTLGVSERQWLGLLSWGSTSLLCHQQEGR
jgi:diketogulonate reductase-like aldo/keto reductase